MRYYADLLKLRCFTKADVTALTGSSTAASQLLTEYHKRGYVDQVRRGLWVTLGLDDKQPVASRYQIACAVTPEAYVSHHSAFEFHGYANQVNYEVCVTSATRFTPFEYDDVTYRWLAPRIRTGTVPAQPGVLVTDLERTVLDSINDLEKIGGLSELLASLEMLPYLDGAKLLPYLGRYDKNVLYQKTGYLLSQFNQTLRLPESFFAQCHAHVGKSVRYLDQDLPDGDKTYDPYWQLVVPHRPMAALTQGIS
ncbi:MAG: type IV toxin-antitoxin system AbiEi family antitoxin domain-containing protein [Propionibacteriaceae bacterium]|nr:type IV toxin-antitoxin system AbiEi family antitoxin domain-containing protein [Propionibacteriaceae bacterium]